MHVLDETDINLISALEKDARISLKNLGEELGVKTSTIYHRLHKLRESNILENFTIVINPEEIGLKFHVMLTIQVKKIVFGKLDNMFLESFAKYLSEQFDEILFSSVGDDEKIYIIATFKNEETFEIFAEKIHVNPYVEDFDVVVFNDILKGKKIFTFQKQSLNLDDQGEFFDDMNINSQYTT